MGRADDDQVIVVGFSADEVDIQAREVANRITMDTLNRVLPPLYELLGRNATALDRCIERNVRFRRTLIILAVCCSLEAACIFVLSLLRR